MTILENEEGNPEIGFSDTDIAEKFVSMVYNYAKELQGNTDKFVMKYISEIVKLSLKRKLISLEDLYIKKEEDLCSIFDKSFPTWKIFNEASNLVRTDKEPNNRFYISFETKKRNTIPLVHAVGGDKRVIEVSNGTQNVYDELKQYKDSNYAYVEKIHNL